MVIMLPSHPSRGGYKHSVGILSNLLLPKGSICNTYLPGFLFFKDKILSILL